MPPLVCGASVRGPAHATLGLPCQDAFAYTRMPDGFTVAVADGLGSAPRSDIGAFAATRIAVCHGLRSHEEPSRVAAGAVARARRALEKQATRDGCELRDLATTLIVVAWRSGRAGIAHIGDGAVVGFGGERAWMLSPPGASEYLNEVDPLTADDWFDHVRVSETLPGLDGVAVFTDGLHHAGLRPDGRPHDGFFAPIVGYVRDGGDPSELAVLLEGPKLNEHSDDDKTLVVALA